LCKAERSAFPWRNRVQGDAAQVGEDVTLEVMKCPDAAVLMCVSGRRAGVVVEFGCSREDVAT
jgi:hypothetical protein